MTKDQSPSDKACDAYFDNPCAATSGSYYSDRATFYAGFKAGAASRDAEIAGLHHIIDEEAKDSALVIIERDQLRKELDIEQMRLVACDVIAMADTKTSAIEARKMHPDYRSPACESVERRVDECITLREQVKMLRDALEKASNTLADERLWSAVTICEKALDATEPKEKGK